MREASSQRRSLRAARKACSTVVVYSVSADATTSAEMGAAASLAIRGDRSPDGGRHLEPAVALAGPATRIRHPPALCFEDRDRGLGEVDDATLHPLDHDPFVAAGAASTRRRRWIEPDGAVRAVRDRVGGRRRGSRRWDREGRRTRTADRPSPRKGRRPSGLVGCLGPSGRGLLRRGRFGRGGPVGSVLGRLGRLQWLGHSDRRDRFGQLDRFGRLDHFGRLDRSAGRTASAGWTARPARTASAGSDRLAAGSAGWITSAGSHRLGSAGQVGRLRPSLPARSFRPARPPPRARVPRSARPSRPARPS